MVSLPASTSVGSPAAAELADALLAALLADSLLALLALLADALPEADALDDEPPDEQPTKASAAATITTAAKTMNFLVFIRFLSPSFRDLPLRALCTHVHTIAQNT